MWCLLEFLFLVLRRFWHHSVLSLIGFYDLIFWDRLPLAAKSKNTGASAEIDRAVKQFRAAVAMLDRDDAVSAMDSFSEIAETVHTQKLDELEAALNPPNNRRRWWQKIFD